MNRFTVVERRPDMVRFVNGLPLGVIELENPADEQTTILSAYRQLQTCKDQVPSLFAGNAALVVSDGTEARIGTLTAGREWFEPWHTISGETLADAHLPRLRVMLEGLCERRRFLAPVPGPGSWPRFLALVRDFIVFEDGGGAPVRKMAGYHRLHVVETAVGETLRAAELQRTAEERGRYESGRKPGGAPGDRRIGVVRHAHGSGKSPTMAFAGWIVREPAMGNPIGTPRATSGRAFG